jgi:RNA polymerase sigma-70 factor (sigma-E family)
MLETMESRGHVPTHQVGSRTDPAPVETVDRRPDETFEAFFDANASRLYRAMYLVGCDAAEAEDLAQEAFVRVWERWGRVKGMADPVGYLYRTAMNDQRSRWRHRGVQAKHAGEQGPNRRDPLAQVDDRDAVIRALGTLPKRTRAALVLIDYLGYSSEQAARVLGVRAATVRSLASQGRKALRERTGGRDG